MIQVEVIGSNDFDSLGVRTYSSNEIFIGHRRGDVLIHDDKIIDYHFKIEVSESKIMGSIHPDLKNFLLNGKMAQGKVSLKLGDTLTFGKSTVKLNLAAYENTPSYKQITNANLEKLMQNHDPLLEIVKRLEKIQHEC